jgi:hypothetical protein
MAGEWMFCLIARGSLLLSTLVTIASCANLTAVSDFAKLSSDVTANTPAIVSYPTAAREMARMSPPAERALRNQQAKEAADQTQVAALGLKTLSLYFSTLSKLADNNTVNVKSAASSISSSLQSFGAIKPSIADPATAIITLLLTAPLDAWRRQAVANLIDRANEPVQRLARDLANFAKGVAQAYDRDISQANIYYTGLGARSSDPGVRAMLDEYRIAHIAEYSKARDQALAAETALRKIEQAHADLQAHKSDLNGAELKALLAMYGDDLKQAAKLFPLPFQL